MAKISSYTYKIALFLGIVFIVLLLLFRMDEGPDSKYVSLEPKATHANGQHYVGSESCKECHAEIYNSHIGTAHYKTSAPATFASVKGSFEKGHNSFLLNDSILIRMTSKGENLYQEIWDAEQKKLHSRFKMDIAIGSGTKGQSYLSWQEDKLFQLQVSYLEPSDHWANSPGMGPELRTSLRPAKAKCLECHTTFAKATSLYGMGNSYDQERIVYGIDCERCHGPAKDHVEAHRNDPNLEIPEAILQHDTLTRQQRLDACILCHSGTRLDIQPAFLFLTGDDLNDFSLPDKNASVTEEIDVHGNQYDLLRNSACFQKTSTMDCTTCHNPHMNQQGHMAYFNQKCMTCHANQHIADSPTPEKLDCVNCHMPLQPSKTMFVQQHKDSAKVPVKVRSHLIAIYADKLMENVAK